MMSSFDYAVLRIVPRVDREEFVNAGVIVHCLERRFLRAQVEINEVRLSALYPLIDLETVRLHLEAFVKVCARSVDGGPIALLSQRERFHWLVAPRSTIIQISPVHSGLCGDPQGVLEKLFQDLVVVDR